MAPAKQSRSGKKNTKDLIQEFSQISASSKPAASKTTTKRKHALNAYSTQSSNQPGFPASDSEYIMISSGSSTSSIVEIPPPSTSRRAQPSQTGSRKANLFRATAQLPSRTQPSRATNNVSQSRKRSQSNASIGTSDSPRTKPVKRQSSAKGRSIAKAIIIESSEDDELPRVVQESIMLERPSIRKPLAEVSPPSHALPSNNFKSSKSPKLILKSLDTSKPAKLHRTSVSSVSSKRSVPDSPVDMQSPKRVRLSASISDSEEQRQEVIPSSEGEEESELMPIDRQDSQGHLQLHASSSTISSSSSYHAHNTPFPANRAQEHKGARVLSATHSEIEVTRELLAASQTTDILASPKGNPTISEPATPSAGLLLSQSSSIVPSASTSFTRQRSGPLNHSSGAPKTPLKNQPESDSDADSVDSAKLLGRILKTEFISDDDSDMDAFDYILDPRRPKTPVGVKSDTRAFSARQIRSAARTLVTDSPLSEPQSPAQSQEPLGRQTRKRFAHVEVLVPRLAEIKKACSASVASETSRKSNSDNFSVRDRNLPETPRKPCQPPASIHPDIAVDESIPEELAGLLQRKDKMDDILKGDKVAHEQELAQMQDALGRTMWKPLPATADVITAKLALDLGASESPTLALLKQAAEINDLDLISSLLSSDILLYESSLPDTLLDWLLDLSVLHHSQSVGHASATSLERLLSGPSHPIGDVFLDYSTVRRLLVGLGAREDFLALLPVGEDNQDEAYALHIPTGRDRKDSQLWRLVWIIGMFARRNQLDESDLPPIITTLTFVAMDVATSAELKAETMHIIRMAFKCIELARKPPSVEMNVLQMLLNACKQLPVNSQTTMLHTLAAWNDRSMRVTRWLAYGLLFGSITAMKSKEKYFNPPPLARVHSLVLSNEIEEVEGGTTQHSLRLNPDTDYCAIRSTTTILGVLMTGLDAYAAYDKRTSSNTLFSISTALKNLQGKIADNRASDLDKTYAKNAIHHLFARMDFQVKKSQS